MAQVLVRNLEGKTVEALKRRARQNRRSLQEELRGILEEAGRQRPVDHVAVALRIRGELARKGVGFGDSGEEQAEDRRR